MCIGVGAQIVLCSHAELVLASEMGSFLVSEINTEEQKLISIGNKLYT